MAEGIITKHFSDYDHFGMNDVPRSVGLKIAEEWSDAAIRIKHLPSTEAAHVLNLQASYRSNLVDEVTQHRDSIAAMLEELAVECRRMLQQNEWLCILGM